MQYWVQKFLNLWLLNYFFIIGDDGMKNFESIDNVVSDNFFYLSFSYVC